MGRPRILDIKIMNKIADIKKKNIQEVNTMVSKKASRLSISPEASLVVLAKELGIGVASYQRKLSPDKQSEIRDSLSSSFGIKKYQIQKHKGKEHTSKNQPSEKIILKHVIECLIQDSELKDRCGDILLAASHFDRPISQATLVLEDRIRKKSQAPKRLVGENLVGFAFNADLTKTRLKISDDSDDQRGFTEILRGIVPTFRNKTHHHIIKTFSREDALRVCGFIDVLLRIVDKAILMGCDTSRTEV